MAAIRQSYDSITVYVHQWVFETIRYVPCWSAAEAAGWNELWLCMCLEDDVIAVAMNLQIRFTNGFLLVVSAVADDPNWLGAVTTLLLALWKFRMYTDSRWLSLGGAARRLVMAELTGLTSMLSFPT